MTDLQDHLINNTYSQDLINTMSGAVFCEKEFRNNKQINKQLMDYRKSARIVRLTYNYKLIQM